ncbi:MAG: NAD-dependent epimerase/dehydratase family protein [Thermosulfidibacteraceae bacterium]|jgi:nucleoside-diphosphate-sugar epimerase
MAKRKNIAVIGSSGFLGRHIVNTLLNCGYNVSGFSRKKVLFNDERFSWQYLDIEDNKLVLDIDWKRFDAVIHNSGLVATSNPGRFWSVNAKGTANVVWALEEAGYSGKFVYVSSLAVYGPGEHSVGDEPKPISEYGKSKLFAEEIVSRSDLNWSIIRPPVIFGEYDAGLKGIVRIVSKGIGVKWNKPKRVSVVYAGNVASAIVDIVEKAEKSTIFTIKDADLTWSEFSVIVSELSGRKIKFWITLDDLIVKVFFYPAIVFGCVTSRSTFFNRDKLKELLASSWTYRETNIESLRYRPRYSLREALLSSIVNWYLVE